MISAAGLQALVIPALALTSVAPVLLILLVARDVKRGALW